MNHTQAIFTCTSQALSQMAMSARTLMAVALAATASISQAQSQPGATQEPVTIGTATTTTVQVIHESVLLPVNFDVFTRNLKFLLGRYDPDDFALAAVNPKHGLQRLQAAQGEQGLMLFQGSNDHGALFATLGQSRKAVRYHLGNPQIALTMTRYNISAALYAPLTMLVYQVDENATRVEYIRPSTQFGQFKIAEIDKVGKVLDGKLINLVNKAATLKPE